MRITRFFLLGVQFLGLTTAAQQEKRQEYSELLELASLAGVTLPTNPAALLSLATFAEELASALPTAPVLSVLETAVPSGFLSEIVNNPSYAASFESAFAAGSSPSWFLALPSEVKSYLHTYEGYVSVASAVAGVDSAEAAASSAAANASSVALAEGITATATTTVTLTESGGIVTVFVTTESAPGSRTSMVTATSMSTGGSASASASASTSATANFARESGALAAAVAGVVGVLGLAVAL